jgi:hypothetical protein
MIGWLNTDMPIQTNPIPRHNCGTFIKVVDPGRHSSINSIAIGELKIARYIDAI